MLQSSTSIRTVKSKQPSPQAVAVIHGNVCPAGDVDFVVDYDYETIHDGAGRSHRVQSGKTISGSIETFKDLDILSPDWSTESGRIYVFPELSDLHERYVFEEAVISGRKSDLEAGAHTFDFMATDVIEEH